MMGYPRKTCKKAKAASLSLLCDGEEGLAALCEGVGGETCYPSAAAHKLRRAGRGFCGEPQVGDAGEISIVSSSARRALQAALIFGSPRRSPPASVFGKRSSAPNAGRTIDLQGDLQGDLPLQGDPQGDPQGDEPRVEHRGALAECHAKDKKDQPAAGAGAGMEGHAAPGQQGLVLGLGAASGAAADRGRGQQSPRGDVRMASTTGFWGMFRSRLQRGACCAREAPAPG